MNVPLFEENCPYITQLKVETYGYGMVWYGMVWYGMVWYGMVWYGMVWYGMVWYGMVWYGMNGMVCKYVSTCMHDSHTLL